MAAVVFQYLPSGRLFFASRDGGITSDLSSARVFSDLSAAENVADECFPDGLALVADLEAVRDFMRRAA